MRTSHLADERHPVSTACGYPWEPWQDPSTRVTLQMIRDEPNARVRILLRETREQQIREESTPVRFCPACARIAAEGGRG